MLQGFKSIPKKYFNNQKCYRLIPSKFPPISLFDDVSDEDEFEALYNIQRITNPRIQEQVGNLNLVSKNERVYNIPGAGYIMAAFTHINPTGSRFSNGMYGIFYAANMLNTAIKETVHHREKFFKATNEPGQDIDMRCLVANFSGDLLDVAADHYIGSNIYNKNCYNESQKFAHEIRLQMYNGIYYNSVRDNHGKNYAIFTPKVFKSCIQQAHYVYRWNGYRIIDIYKKDLIMEL